jgi:predicted nucleic-acid-binding Zn-ribbon protein/peroxiredoxin
MTTIHAEVGLGASAPDAELRGAGGNTVFLSSYWDEQPLVLVLLNDLHAEASADRVYTLRDAHETFDEAGGAIVVVARNAIDDIAAFRSERNVGFAILSDGLGSAHLAYAVPSNGVATFVIDKGGIIRYAHRGQGPLETPSTWTLIDAVCGLTGATVERPEPAVEPAEEPSLLHPDPARPSFVTGAAVRPPAERSYTCPKCGNSAYEVSKMAATGGWLSRIFNFQYKTFAAITCTACNFTELYRTKSGTLANIADILAGR